MFILNRLSTFSLLLLAGFFTISGVSARPSNLEPTNAFAKRAASLPSRQLQTNAERMAVGLPPLKPRQLFTPTRVAARAEPSPLPPVSGRILVRNAATKEFLGYVSNATDNGGRYNVDTDGADDSLDLHVRFSPYSSSITPFDIVILPEGGEYPFLGFWGKNVDLTGSADNELTATKETPPGSVPVKVGTIVPGNSDYSESAIWLYDSTTGKLTAIWINPTPGKATVTTEFYAPSDLSGKPGDGNRRGILQVKAGSPAPDRYQKVTLEIAI